MKVCMSILGMSMKSLGRKSNSLRNVMKFRFSNSQSTLERSQERLGKTLQIEFEHEEEENSALETEVNETISQFIKQNNWSFKIDQGITRITMEKVIGDTTIQVFTSVKAAQNDEDQNSEEKEDDEQEEQSDDKYNDFFVVVSRSGKNKSIFFDVVTFDGEMEITNFYPIENSELSVNKRMTYTQTELYVGPMFDSLDEKVQTGTVNYLKSLGIDSNLGKFLESVSRDLEQKYYMDWLDQTRSFFD